MASLTRKDFIAMAKTVARTADAYTREKLLELTVEICLKSNPRFDRERFIQYVAQEMQALGHEKFK